MDIAASKFLSSLVKSLQILCNGHLEFDAGIELVGHINVKIDKHFKFNCILDEQVSKQANDSTTFCSSSYHSLPPSAQKSLDHASEAHTNLRLSTSQHGSSHLIASPIMVESLERKSDRQHSTRVAMTKATAIDDCQSVIKVEDEDDSAEGCRSIPSTSVSGSVQHSVMDTDAGAHEGPVQDDESSAWFQSNGKVKVEPWSPGHNLLHQDTIHTEERSNSPAETLHSCTNCQCLFRHYAEFVAHVEDDSTECSHAQVSYCCSLCFFSSVVKGIVDQHVFLHRAVDKQYQCDSCNLHFKSYNGLRMHKQAKHSPMPNFKCSLCGKVLHNKMNLDGHMNQHKGLKPHTCTFCSRTFSYKQSQKAHEKLCPEKMKFLLVKKDDYC